MGIPQLRTMLSALEHIRLSKLEHIDLVKVKAIRSRSLCVVKYGEYNIGRFDNK